MEFHRTFLHHVYDIYRGIIIGPLQSVRSTVSCDITKWDVNISNSIIMYRISIFLDFIMELLLQLIYIIELVDMHDIVNVLYK